MKLSFFKKPEFNNRDVMLRFFLFMSYYTVKTHIFAVFNAQILPGGVRGKVLFLETVMILSDYVNAVCVVLFCIILF